MKQLIQNARTGAIELADVPAPMAAAGQVLVQNHYSVMSPGTDKLAMSFARKSMLGKARSRPDLVKQVIKKMRTDGPTATYRAASSRLDSPQPLGYSSAGVVLEVGEGVTDFAAGDRVACAGAGYANHSEIVSVPENLVAHVPDGVDLSDAAYATLGAIAMQGLRIAAPTLGELGVVIGLGIIGQISVQLLRANGCRALGVDLNPTRVKQALDHGAEWALSPEDLSDSWIAKVTGGHGFDLALVTAASSSSAPLELAANLLRKKGRISFVGAMPIEIDRRLMFEKELDLRMSTSYGPGRYDRNYEEVGLDYPLPYVRWTENRNLQAFLALAASGAIAPSALDCRSRPFAEAVESYEELEAGGVSQLGVQFEYETTVDLSRSAVVATTARPQKSRSQVGVAFIGAGAYAKAVLLPLLQNTKGVEPITLITATGASAQGSAKRFGFTGCGTDPDAVFKDPNVDLVFVTTRHNTHVDYAVAALSAGKNVWLEKPAALTAETLDLLTETVEQTGGTLLVGYNRRYSPHAVFTRNQFSKRGAPIRIYYRINAGPMPSGTWIVDPNEGGGRIVGEACHFVDLCNYFVGDLVQSVSAHALGSTGHDDSMTISLNYADGSVATIDYLAMASPQLNKEYIELSSEGKTVQLDNFRSSQVVGGARHKTLNQEKGQKQAIEGLIQTLLGNSVSPDPVVDTQIQSIANVSRTTFAILASSRAGKTIEIDG